MGGCKKPDADGAPANGCAPAPSNGCGPAASNGCAPTHSNGCGPAAKGCGPASKGCGPASNGCGPASKTPSPAATAGCGPGASAAAPNTCAAPPSGVTADAQRASVSEYYGETLTSTADLKTSACCPIGTAPPAHAAILARVHPAVLSRFYGCGSPLPDALRGARVVDLGCGTGRDAYLASALVGATGGVVGVDMTEAQLAVARAHVRYHADAFLGEGAEPNVRFLSGLIEDLAAAGVPDGEADVVISNCVCNLSPDKGAVFRGAARALRAGGELYFSDIYTDRRLPDAARADDEMVAECLGGALYAGDFAALLRGAGLGAPRVVSAAPVVLHDARLRALAPGARFFSVTYRAFKVQCEGCEDYGQEAVYDGGGDDETRLVLDERFAFPKGVAVRVDADTARVLQESRYAKHFKVTRRGEHRGMFFPGDACGPVAFLAQKGGAPSGEVAGAEVKVKKSGCC